MGPDQTAPEEQSDQDPQCLLFCLQLFDAWHLVKSTFSKVRMSRGTGSLGFPIFMVLL